MKACDDWGLDSLLDWNGTDITIGKNGEYRIRIQAIRIPPSPERPHGLNYELTLLGPGGARLVGFDNAHSVRPTEGPSGRVRARHDHRHLRDTMRSYEYRDAATLWDDFWEEVETALRNEEAWE